jgi:hypothetical protein
VALAHNHDLAPGFWRRSLNRHRHTLFVHQASSRSTQEVRGGRWRSRARGGMVVPSPRLASHLHASPPFRLLHGGCMHGRNLEPRKAMGGTYCSTPCHGLPRCGPWPHVFATNCQAAKLLSPYLCLYRWTRRRLCSCCAQEPRQLLALRCRMLALRMTATCGFRIPLVLWMQPSLSGWRRRGGAKVRKNATR